MRLQSTSPVYMNQQKEPNPDPRSYRISCNKESLVMSALLGHPRSKDRRKDRDEDLLLFREMHRRTNISLLQPVSDEFEPNCAGSIPIYRLAPSKKSSGNEFLAENDKNDYDWLKTPPATPLFPSLELEPNAAGIAVHRELPITQPLSRFAGNSKDTNRMIPRTKPKIPPRLVTPSQRPSSSQADSRSNSSVPASGGMAQLNEQRNRRTVTTPSRKATTSVNLKNIGADHNSNVKPRSRAISPLVRSTSPAQFPGFSDETPPNLMKDRATSASRGQPNSNSKPVLEAQIFSNPRRQSCSPSVMRGRKEPTQASDVRASSSSSSSSQKPRPAQIGGNGSLVLGSRMVEKMMNARKSGTGPKTPAPRQPDASSIKRTMKHMDARRDRTTSTHHVGTMASRSPMGSSLAQ